MATSEIEKLERRYAENPHGLTFAPLAEVHRKNGDISRAIELLTAGLELHPNYIPASIVLGRCHQDLGDQASAEAAFAHVLRLDDENVIALKSLADINEGLQRYTAAENWLRRLVAIDRSNDEAKEQLRRVEAAKHTETASGSPGEKVNEEPAVVAEPSEADEPTLSPVLELIDLSPEPAGIVHEPVEPLVVVPEIAALDVTHNADRPAATPATSEEDRENHEEALRDILIPVVESERREPPVTAPEVVSSAPREPLAEERSAVHEMSQPEQVEVESSSPAEPVGPLPGLISAEFQPPLEAIGGLDVETSDEVVLEVSGDPEFRVPDASEDLKELSARLSGPAPPTPAAARDMAPATPPPPEPPFVVTETMAEVLVQQGHMDEALRVYRELARQNGGDARLEARILELEAAAAQQPTKPRSYLARDTKGQSVAAFFHSLLTARPPFVIGAVDRPSSEATGHAASGNGAPGPGYGEEGVPAPPAVSGDKSADEAVSFDQFFGSAQEGSTAAEHENAEPGKDDLDQFQSWLQNLKR